ncbi:lysoplasmalogenase family protein [Flavobacterium caeni]|uniref:YhhN-like protein n=1 Tax=Flavobacterium caeni TaxID=490189 RepID=A0A1G5BEC1_9FLAO|nr:lysoplasmalogenase family protein [Flavobacterium caeni]SCX88515.1 YhhN-like protein [Flavobacterium caeni]
MKAVVESKSVRIWYRALAAAYFSVAVFEIVAEFLKEKPLIMATKPLLMPLMIVLYLHTSKRRNPYFVTALFFSWIANMLFVSTDFNYIITGTLFFTAYRVLVIFIVVRHIKIPGVIPLFIGCLPFLFIYLFTINLTYEEQQDGFWLFLLQGIFTIIFGGLSLGSYIFKSNRANTYLLISTMLFTFTQFLFVIRLFYTINIFQPLAMLLYVVGQFLLFKFLIIEEKKLAQNQN